MAVHGCVASARLTIEFLPIMTIKNELNTNTTRPGTRETTGRTNFPNVAKTKANAFAVSLITVLEDLAGEGVDGQVAIAAALNARGVPTARNGKWAVTTVTNLIGRLAVLQATKGAA
jgi:hypothetical protein